MQIASSDSVRLVHLAEGSMREEHRPCESFGHFEEWGWKLEHLHLGNDLVDSTAALFADAETPHQ